MHIFPSFTMGGGNLYISPPLPPGRDGPRREHVHSEGGTVVACSRDFFDVAEASQELVEARLVEALPSFSFAEAEGPAGRWTVGSKVDHTRSEGDMTALDLHLHDVAFEDAEQLLPWHIAVKVVEERTIVTVVAIKPQSSGRGWSDPKR